MTEETAKPYIPEQLPPPPPSIWLKIWYRAISEPYALAYQDLARRADMKTTYLWYALLYLVPCVLILALHVVDKLASADLGQILDFDLGLIGMVVMCLLSTVASIATYSSMTALSNVIAKAFGGQGDFRRLMYCVVAYTIPVTIVLWILGIFVLVPCLAIPVILGGIGIILYSIVLNVIAIKAVHQIETWQAVVSAIAAYALPMIVGACLTIVMFMIEYLMAGNRLSTVIAGVLTTLAY